MMNQFQSMFLLISLVLNALAAAVKVSVFSRVIGIFNCVRQASFTHYYLETIPNFYRKSQIRIILETNMSRKSSSFGTIISMTAETNTIPEIVQIYNLSCNRNLI